MTFVSIRFAFHLCKRLLAGEQSGSGNKGFAKHEFKLDPESELKSELELELECESKLSGSHSQSRSRMWTSCCHWYKISSQTPPLGYGPMDPMAST